MAEEGKATRRGSRMKTWSSFGNLGRVPTEYEIVTHGMNHTARGETPLELGADVLGNQWLIKHRDGIALTVEDWEAYRDPDQVTYRAYTRQQDEQETYIDGLLNEYTVVKGSDQALSADALGFLQTSLTPCRYLSHGLMMMSAYIQQLAPSSYIANCGSFQAADQLRRVQRIAYRTKQLAIAHPDRGFGDRERSVWEQNEGWQPIRKAVEALLVAFDWDDAVIGTNLVVKPITDQLFLRAFGPASSGLGNELDALINDNLFLDSERSRRWNAALCNFLIEADAGNRATLMDRLKAWAPHGEAIIEAGSALIASGGGDAAAIAADARQDWKDVLAASGLSDDA